KGWQTVTSKGESNVFWERKGPWMAAKGALKNCCRLAFPHLAGLMSRPELGEEEPTSDAAVPARSRDVLYRRLFALGAEVAPPGARRGPRGRGRCSTPTPSPKALRGPAGAGRRRGTKSGRGCPPRRSPPAMTTRRAWRTSPRPWAWG